MENLRCGAAMMNKIIQKKTQDMMRLTKKIVCHLKIYIIKKFGVMLTLEKDGMTWTSPEARVTFVSAQRCKQLTKHPSKQ